MELTLSGRTYLVTGGGSGIGKGIAESLFKAGGNVLIVGRTSEKLAVAAEELKACEGPWTGSVRVASVDVTDEQQVANAVNEAADWNGRLHGVVHCAGGSETIGPITQIDSAAWRRAVDLNINGAMYVLKHSAQMMVRGGGGSFVGISSIAASNTHRWFGAYGVSKAALDHLLMLGADELGASNVRVNGIRPGLTRTELLQPVFDSQELSETYRVNTPLPRFGEVDDVAMLTLFLLSDAAGWITGQLINVDGGHMLRQGPDFSALLLPAFGADGLRGVVN
jgi:7-alpha-hydroxysteroid dehydrogenase